MADLVTEELSYQEVLSHIKLHHPRCPGQAAQEVIKRVLGRRRWRGERLGKAVGVEMQNVIRHNFTSYDALYDVPGMDWETARATIKPKVEKKLAKWRRTKPADPTAVA